MAESTDDVQVSPSSPIGDHMAIVNLNVTHHGPLYTIGHISNALMGPNYGQVYQNADRPEQSPEGRSLSTLGDPEAHRREGGLGKAPALDRNGSHIGEVHVSDEPASELHRILKPIPNSSHNRDRKKSPPDSSCMAGTRVAVVKEIVRWADKTNLLTWGDSSHILWLYGYVGCGKSAIAQAIAEKFGRRKRLAASFFFFRASGARSKAGRFAMTIACQVAAAVPSAGPYILSAAKTHVGLLTHSSLDQQFQRLVYEPLMEATKGNPFKSPFLIVVDGLDECDDRADVARWITDTINYFETHPRIPLKFLITSRVEEHIRKCLILSPEVRLVNLVDHAPLADIGLVMRRTLENAAKSSRVIQAHGKQWPEEIDLQKLIEHTGGSFIFMATILKFILDHTDAAGPNPIDRIQLALKINPGLDGLYTQTLATAEHIPHFIDVISTIALLKEPLSIMGLAELLNIPPADIVQVLLPLQPILHVPGDDRTPVTLCHTSLHDYLNAPSRSKRFSAQPSRINLIVEGCFRSFAQAPERETIQNEVRNYAERFMVSHWASKLEPSGPDTDSPRLRPPEYPSPENSGFDRAFLSTYLMVHRNMESNTTLPRKAIMIAEVAGNLLDGSSRSLLSRIPDNSSSSWCEMGGALSRYLEQEGLKFQPSLQDDYLKQGVQLLFAVDVGHQRLYVHEEQLETQAGQYVCSFWLRDLVAAIETDSSLDLTSLSRRLKVPVRERLRYVLAPRKDSLWEHRVAMGPNYWPYILERDASIAVKAIERKFSLDFSASDWKKMSPFEVDTGWDMEEIISRPRSDWNADFTLGFRPSAISYGNEGVSILDALYFFYQLSLCMQRKCEHRKSSCEIQRSPFGYYARQR
ncbi:hypothetical protein DFP72DRAFT_1044735 [Ephemerocybe angulata]|uniref:Nephrocystin 3-like N-terminal domain-containing protein n=1 Tax=Ephemerocybe angulata TaxID=980116 RepID=A0A8H6I0N7_9AGAR|nr:hypothetical protein DFP72DRAFT_1044735 [Tulosesus angulatus]